MAPLRLGFNVLSFLCLYHAMFLVYFHMFSIIIFVIFLCVLDLSYRRIYNQLLSFLSWTQKCTLRIDISVFVSVKDVVVCDITLHGELLI